MHALKVLEFDSILVRLAKHCETELGAELSTKLQPLFEDTEVWDLQAQTSEAYILLGKDSPPSLGRVLDLRSALIRAEKGGVLGVGELYCIGELLASLRLAKVFFQSRPENCPILFQLVQYFPDEQKLEFDLLDSLESDGEVKDSASATLAALRKRKFQASARILEKIQSYVSGKSREYLSDPLFTVRDGRYVLPVKSEHRAKIRGLIHDTSGTGQTVFIEPDDVLKAGNDLREIEGLEREEIQRILAEFSARVGQIASTACPAIVKAADLDLILAKARLGFEMEALPPRKSKSASLQLDGARHPLLDKSIVVPVTIEVGFDFEGLLITGPNTGGKTVAIKCAGLCVLMAQSGLMIPARDCEFGTFSQIWADIGDEQSIAQSLSTFSGHIKNIAEAIKSVQPGALALFDELGAGTDPAEGAALAKAILRAMHARGARIIASTHYGELKAFAYSEPGFLNAAMEFDAKSLRPTYRLMLGAPGASQAMKIAERYGIPSAVIEDAKLALGDQQQDIAQMIEQLELAQKLARNAQSEADRKSAELRQADQRAAQKLAEADEIRRTVNQRAKDEIESTLRELRLQAAEIFESLKHGAVDQKKIDEARKQLKAVQSLGEEEAVRYEVPKLKPAKSLKFSKGVTVRVDGYSQHGVLLEEPKDHKVMVQIGALKLTVPTSKLTAYETPNTPNYSPKKSKANILLQRAASAPTEISLRAMRAEDAIADLEKFVDDAVLGSLHRIRIVHGKGEGVLRRIVHDYLKRRKEIESYQMAESGEGGDGVTVAFLK